MSLDRPNLPSVPTVPKELQTLSIQDTTNRYSVVNLVAPEVAKAVSAIPSDLLSMSEEQFVKKYEPDETDYRLKLRFWDEWQASLLCTTEAHINMAAVYYGVCTREYFYAKILKDPVKLAWMVVPPVDYATAMRELLYRGTSRIKDILSLPFVTEEPILVKGQPIQGPDGKPLTRRKVDKGLISEVRQIIAMLSDRVHGAIVQRMSVQQKNLNLNVAANNQDPMPTFSTELLSSIDSQLDQLNAKLRPLELGAMNDLSDSDRRLIERAGVDPATIDAEISAES